MLKVINCLILILTLPFCLEMLCFMSPAFLLLQMTLLTLSLLFLYLFSLDLLPLSFLLFLSPFLLLPYPFLMTPLSKFIKILMKRFMSFLMLSDAPAQLAILRRSARTTKPPSYLKAYHYNQVKFVAIPSSSNHVSGISHPLQSYLSYTNLSSSYKSFCCTISSIIEPIFYHQAIGNPKWQATMDVEILALEANCTWTVTSLPPSKKLIGCKWVYRVKYKSDGLVERYKARLVAKGFTQKNWLDYIDTFSPVAKMVSIKAMLAVATVKG